MRTILSGAGIAMILALAGCGDRKAEEANRVEANQSVDVANQLAALPEGQRNAVFIRAIRDAGQECQHVESSAQLGEYEGNPVWSAQCEGGGSWTIVVTPDGTAQILNEAEVRLVGVNQVGPQNAQAPAANQQGE